MKKFQLTRRSLIVSTRVAATVAIFLNLATGKVERCVGRKLELILHEDFIKKVHFYFLRRATAYLAFWSSICCPEYIFLLGSWSTLPERVPSSLFAFRTLLMKEWLWCNHHIIFDFWKIKFTSFAKRTASFSISWAWAKLCGLSNVLNDSFSSLANRKYSLFWSDKEKNCEYSSYIRTKLASDWHFQLWQNYR